MYRSRLFKNATDSRNVLLYSKNAGQNPVLAGTYPTLVNYDYEIMNDVVVKDFRKRQARGEVIVNPCYRPHLKISAGGGSFSMTDTSTGFMYYYDTSPGGSLSTRQISAVGPLFTRWGDWVDTQTSAITQAKFDAVSNIDPTPYAFMEDLLTLKSTMSTLMSSRDNLKSLGSKFESAVKKRGKAKGISLASAASDVWLTGKFGFGNILHSCINAFEAFDAGLSHHSKDELRRAVGEKGKSLTHSEVVIVGSVPVGQSTFTHDLKYTTYSRAYVYYKVSNPCNNLRGLLGLRIKDLPAGIWQALPYTWVIDQFMNVSGAIRGFTALTDPSINVIAGGVGTKDSSVETRQWTNYAHTGWSIALSSDVVKDDNTAVYRQTWTPSLADVKPPLAFDVPASWGTCASDIAFAVQKIAKLFNTH